MSRTYYKVLFYDKVNDDYYRLCYTSNKKRCLAYYKSEGYNEKEILFIKKVFVGKVGIPPNLMAF